MMLSNKGRKTIQTQKIHQIEWIVLCKTKMTKSSSRSRVSGLVIGGRNEPTPVEHPMKKCDKSLWQKEFWDFFVRQSFKKYKNVL